MAVVAGTLIALELQRPGHPRDSSAQNSIRYSGIGPGLPNCSKNTLYGSEGITPPTSNRKIKPRRADLYLEHARQSTQRCNGVGVEPFGYRTVGRRRNSQLSTYKRSRLHLVAKQVGPPGSKTISVFPRSLRTRFRKQIHRADPEIRFRSVVGAHRYEPPAIRSPEAWLSYVLAMQPAELHSRATHDSSHN